MGRNFTDADRKKALEVRRANKLKKIEGMRNPVTVIEHYENFTDEEWASITFKRLILMANGIIEAEPHEIRACNAALAYLMPKLRATDQELDGDEPINLNELAERAIKEKHGNPWEDAQDDTAEQTA